MNHATPDALAAITSLLDELRRLPALKERSPGIFYRKSRAFLHFHEDAGRLFADVRLSGADFERFPVTAAAQQKRLLAAIVDALD